MVPTRRNESEELESYLEIARHNLIASMNDAAHFQPVSEALDGLKIERALDVGCGVGQMLFPLAALRGAFGVGVDPSPQACRMGREIYASFAPEARISFMVGKAEQLPFASESFDVVNCGLALPYTDNAQAIGEIARVLRPGGLFLLKIHHARYYLRDIGQSLTSRRPLLMVHAGRVLAAGAIYHLTGRQLETRLFGKETFQTRWLLRRQLSRCGLKIERERPDTNPLTPAFVISKEK